MKKIYIAFILGLILVAPAAYAAGKYNLLQTALLKADKIVVSGTSDVLGPIFNDSKTKGKDNPVTIKDNLVVTGTLTTKNIKVSGPSPFIASPSCSPRDSIYWTGLGWSCLNPINNFPDPNLNFQLRRTTTGSALSVYNYSDSAEAYIQLDTLKPYTSPDYSSCTPGSGNGLGNMITDPYSNKLFICMSTGWKSVTLN